MNATSHKVRRSTRALQGRRGNQPAPRLRYKHLAFGVGLALGSLLVCGVASAASGVAATATPTGGKVVGGAGSIAQQAANTIIHQKSKLLALDWQTFNVGKQASVLFKQPSFKAVALNRILDQNPSKIFGQISSNGQVFLINTHGVIFGSSARLNVGGLVASTLDLTPQDFLKKHFDLDAHGGHAGVVNHGIIAAASGGSVSLIGGHVENDGLIVADYGHINLDGASKAVLDFDGNGLINVQITGKLKQRLDTDKAAVVNKGTLKATSGTVVLKASAAKNLFTNLVNNSGVIEAGGISTAGGVVRLVGTGGNTLSSGKINVSGTHGGSVQVLSDHNVAVAGSVHADATQSGNGGNVLVRGDRQAGIAGRLSARGGTKGGDGGFIETSGAHVHIADSARVNTLAPSGQTGTWLIDPQDFTIASGKTGTVTGGVPSGDISGNTLETALGSSDVIIESSEGSTSGTGNINVNDDVSWSNHKLTLTAADNININANVAASGTASLDLQPATANGGDPAVSGGTNIISSTGSLSLAGTGGMTIGGLTNAGTFDISGLGSGLTITSLDGASTGVVKLGANTLTLSNAADTFAGVIKSTGGGLTLSAGTETLSGTNTYTGDTTINGGTLSVSSDANLGNGGGLALNGGTLENTASFALGHAISLGSSGGTLKIDSGKTLTVANAITGSGSFTQNGSGTLQINAHVTTAGKQTYNGAVLLGGDITLKSTGGKNIAFASTVDGGHTLAVDTVGITTFGGVVGGTTALTSLTTDAGGSTKLGGNVTTTGAQTYNDAVALNGDSSVKSTGSGDIDFASTLDGAHNLSVNTGGASSFGGAVGGATALTSLTTSSNTFSAASALDVANGLSITTAGGAIGQNAAWSVGGASTFDAGANAITLANTDNDFAGAVSLTGNDVSLTNNAATVLGTSTVTGTLAVQSDGALTESGVLTVNGAATFTQNSTSAGATQDIDLGSQANSFKAGVTVAAGTGAGVHDLSLKNTYATPGTLTLPAITGDLTLDYPNAAFTLPTLSSVGGALDVTASSITLNGNVTTGGAQSYHDAVTLNGNSTVKSTGNGAIDFASTVDGGHTLAVDTDGVTTFGSVVGGTTALASLSTDGGGSTKLSGNVTTTGMQTYNDAATLGGGVTLKGTTVTLNAVTGGGNNLTVTGDAALDGTVAGVNNLAVSGTTTLDTSSVTTSGTQTYTGAVSLGTDVTLATSNSNVDFGGTVANGGATAESLTVNAGTGDVSFGATVGSASSPLDALTIGGTGTTSYAGAVYANNLNPGTGTTTLTEDVTTTGTPVEFTGPVIVNGSDIAIDTTGGSAVGANISFDGSVDGYLSGSDGLMLTAGTGAVSFGGAVGSTTPLESLSITSGTFSATGALKVGGALSIMTTAGPIGQNAAWTVGGTSYFNAGSSAITLTNSGNDFSGAVSLINTGSDAVQLGNGGNALTLGTLSLGGGALTLDDYGSTPLELTQGITTSGGAIKFGGPVSLGASIVIDTTNGGAASGAKVTFGGTVDNAGGTAEALTIDAGSGNVDFAGALGSGTNGALGALALNSGGYAIFDSTVDAASFDSAIPVRLHGDVTTHGVQIYHDTLEVFASALTLTSNNHDIILNGVSNQVASTATLTVKAGSGAVAFDGDVCNGSATCGNALGLDVTATSGITEGTSGVIGGSGALSFDAGTGSISLDQANAFTGTIDLAGDTATVKSGALKLGSVDVASLHATATSGAITQDSTKTLQVTGTSSLDAGTDAIALTNTSNDFGGAVGITHAGDVELAGSTLKVGTVADTTSLTLDDAATLTGDVTTTGDQTYQGAVALDDSAGDNSLTLTGANVSFNSTLGNANGLGTDQALEVDVGAAGAATFTGAVGTTADPLGALKLDAGSYALFSSTVDADSLDAGLATRLHGDVTTQGAQKYEQALDVFSTALTLTSNNHDIALNDVSNQTSAATLTVDAGSGAVAFNGAVCTSGCTATLGLDVTAEGGISQASGSALDVTASSFDASTTGAITLANSGNDFTGAVTLTGAATQITTSGALALGKVNADSLVAKAGGAISQDTTSTDAITVSGTSSFTTGGFTIDLGNTSNDFGGAVSLANTGAYDVTLKNGDALVLGNVNVGSGTLIVKGAGITQATTTSIKQNPGTGTAVAIFDAGTTHALTLNNTGNDFIGAVTATGAGISVKDANDLNVASLTDTPDHDLSLIAGGALTMPAGSINTGSGNITLIANGGALNLTGSLTGSGITVTAGGGSLAVAALTGDAITLAGKDGITMNGDVTTTSGALKLTSTNASIHQTADSITTCSTCTTTVNAGIGTIALTGTTNNFGGTVSLTGGTTAIDSAHPLTLDTLTTGALTVRSNGALNLGSGTVGGTLNVASNNGDITQSTASGDALTVAGATTLHAGTGSIKLANAGNDFQDLVKATGAGISLRDTNDLAISGFTDVNNGAVSLIAGGTLSGVAPIDAGTNDITLVAKGGPLTTKLLTGNDITLQGAGGITLKADVTATGTLKLTSGSSISQNSGAIITADTLTGSSTGATTLGGANAIGILGNFTANGFSLTSGQALTVASGATVDGGAGGTALTASTDDLMINGTVGNAGSTTTLIASQGAIGEGTGGIVKAATLTGSSKGDTMLGGENVIAALDQFKADNFTLVDHHALTVHGPLLTTGNISLTTTGPGNVLSVGQALTGGVISLDSAGDLSVVNAIQAGAINLTANGDLAINAAVDSGTGVVTLAQNGSSGKISEGNAGVITAGTLTGTAQGSVALDGANAVVSLGDFTANGFSLGNARALTVATGSTVDGGTRTTLKTTGAGSNLAINGHVQGTTVKLTSSSAIGEGGHGVITASVLTGGATNATQLTGTNVIAGIGNFTTNGFKLNNHGPLTIMAGATVDGGSGTTLTTTGSTGNFSIDGTLKGGTIRLTIAGAISEGADGVLDAGTLTGSSSGSTSLDGNNDVDNLGDFTANGFALTTDPGLTVVAGSNVDGRSTTTLVTTGKGNDININGAVTGIRVKLASSGAIHEGAHGLVQAGHLTGSSAGATKLTHAEIGTLDAFKAKSFSLANTRALDVAGPLTTTGDISLTTAGSGNALTVQDAIHGAAITLASAGDLTVADTVTGSKVGLAANGNLAINAAVDSGAGTTTLTQKGSGAITAGANGSIAAATLTGSATGATTLGSASHFVGNHVDVLGGFSSPAGFSFTNDGTLTLASVAGSAYTVDAGKSDLYLAVHNGDLLQNGSNWLYDGSGTWSAPSGHIGLPNAPIYVTGVNHQLVKLIGLPPAYFYAVDYSGNLLPITGANSVNVPTSILSSHSQGINGHTDHYIDIGVITAKYRAYGVVPPGLLLPQDQWDCSPNRPLPGMCPRGN